MRGERKKGGRRQEAGGEGLPAVPLPWRTAASVSICPSLSLSHPPASAAARQTQPLNGGSSVRDVPACPRVSVHLCPRSLRSVPPPFPDRPGLDRTLLPPSSSWVSSSSAASSVASEAGWFRISAGGVPEDTEDTSEDTSQQDRRERTGHRLYLVLLDARQVPAEAQADLPALPVLQEEHGYTHTHTDRFRGRSGDVSTGAVHRRSHPTET